MTHAPHLKNAKKGEWWEPNSHQSLISPFSQTINYKQQYVTLECEYKVGETEKEDPICNG